VQIPIWHRCAAACLVVLTTACVPGPASPRAESEHYAEDQVLRLALSEEIVSLDPALMERRDAVAVAQNVFNGLTKFHEKTLLPEADIADRWDISESGSVYTFHLRRDVRFSNGDPVTARDFKYSWERALDPALHSPVAFLFDIIKGAVEIQNDKTGKLKDLGGVKALDDYTLQVTLTEPANYFLAQAALWVYSVVDARVIAANPRWSQPPGQVVGTGPFKLTAWTGDRLAFQAVTGWWGQPKPRLRAVTLDVVKDATAQVRRYEAGGLDAVSGVPPGELARIQSDPQEARELQILTSLRTTWVGFNFTRAPFAANKKLRRAVCESIDKNQLSRRVLATGTLGTPANSLIPPGVPGRLSVPPDAYPFNPSTARSILREADPDGVLMKDLTYWTSDTPLNRLVAENLAAQWRDNLGITVKIGVASAQEFLRKRRDHEYTLFRGSWGADYPHPYGWLQPVAQSGQEWNTEGYRNPDLDRALQDAARTQRPEEAARKYQAVERTYLQDLAACELYWSTDQYLIKPYVRGYGGNAQLPLKWQNVVILKG
jgi:oligopeptide transport system substrate-binding protein